MKMKSVMQHSFSNIPQANIPRSVFNRSHCHKTTFDAGYLIPFYVDEALPGDTFNMRSTIFARLTTPIVPFMDNLYLDTFYFAVPLRLVWSNFQKFMGEQEDPGDSTDYEIPQLSSTNPSVGFAPNSLADYFGLPVDINHLSVNALFFRAYNLIWNEWFRDQNLQDSATVNKGDSGDAISDFPLLRRGKRHDYFTSCLPWPQKGPSVPLPLGTTAPLLDDSSDIDVTGSASSSGNYLSGSGNSANMVIGTSSPTYLQRSATFDRLDLTLDVNGSFPVSDVANALTVDLSTATAATISSLREAFQIQKLYERDARGGTRYTELVRSHFGVVSPDARLQRPEFLGGGSSPIMVTPVAQTSVTATTPQGNLAGFGTVTSRGEGFTKSFTEHCVVLGLLSVRADLTYQQGIPRMFSRLSRFDFYWPSFAHLGEQAVLNKEIYAQGSDVINPETEVAYDEEVFGYQERYAEYRYYPSKITGKLRSTVASSLDVWHLSQEFGSLPTLDETFIEDNPPVARVVAVQNEPHFVMDSFLECKTVRPMPVYSVPGYIDHF